MEYIKIKADYTYYKGRLTRTLYVKKGIKLHELGCVLVKAFGGAFEHFFLFRSKKISYVPNQFLEEYSESNDRYMNEYTIEDLGNVFSFEYDTGDSWDFDVKVYKTTKKIDSDNYAFIIDGVGQGIWEDNAYSLNHYLEGKIKNLSEQDEEEGIYFPWNFEIESFSDFDLPIDLELIQDGLDIIDEDIELYLEMDGEYFPKEEYEENKDINYNIKPLLIKTLKNQFKDLPYVHDKFIELTNKYGENKAYDMLAAILLKEIYDVSTENRVFDEEKYRKNILNLK